MSKHSTAAIAVLVAFLSLQGCGGGSGSGASTSRMASLQFNLDWPDRNRATPVAANSAVVVLTQNGAVVGQTTLNRPQGTHDASSSSYTFKNLPAGDLDISTTAYPQVDGAGVAVATGASIATLAQGEKIEQTTVLATTATAVELSATTTVVDAGETGEIVATVRDQRGDIVLTKSGDSIDPVVWECDSPNVKLTQTSTGAHFEALASGDAHVKATFEGMSATLAIHVQ